MAEYSQNCLQGTAQTMGRIFSNSMKQHYEKRCKDPDFGPEFIEHNKCFDNQTIFEQFHLCTDRWYYRFQQLPKLQINLAQGVQSGCCILHQFQKCIRDNNVNLCHDKNRLFWDQLIDDAVSGFSFNFSLKQKHKI